MVTGRAFTRGFESEAGHVTGPQTVLLPATQGPIVDPLRCVGAGVEYEPTRDRYARLRWVIE